MTAERVRPNHLIVDQGTEFKCEHFETVWCKTKNILPRFGAVIKHGSIAVVERFHRTMKEILRLIVVSEDQSQFEREMQCIVDGYNESRTHMTLNGKTPNEVHFCVHQPTSSHVLSPAQNARADRRARCRLTSTVSPEIRSSL